MSQIFYTYYSYEEFGRGYIGYRKCPKIYTPDQDPYRGSYTDKTFKPSAKIVLTTHPNAEEAREAERKIQEFFDVLNNPHFVNKSIQTGKGFYIKNHTEDTKNKIRDAARGRIISPETRKKQSESKKGKKLSDEVVEKLKLRRHSKEAKAKMSSSHRGVPKSPEHRKSISISKMGEKNPMYGTSKTYSFKNEITGHIEVNVTIKDMCSRYGLKSCGLYQLKNKKVVRYKNWTLLE
jgi:curved DNA-binding protein CbpA